jgi:hypothetical protein
MNYYPTYVKNALVDENVFISMAPEVAEAPEFAGSHKLLPQPFWAGHDAAIACYWKVWEIAFRNINKPTRENGFVAHYIDTAFNGNLFMWDSAFILMFARYGSRAFNFQRTLDNLYCKQHPDGFICREIRESNGQDLFHRFDPASTGPNIMPWTEWEYFLTFGDRERLARVFPVLTAYHQWLRTYRTWLDGSYWTSGWGCGMDNQPRVTPGYSPEWSHGHQAWVDACFQQLYSAHILLSMAGALGRSAEIADFRAEFEQLSRFANDKLWDETAAFYYDRRRDGSRSGVKTIGAYWAVIAGAAPAGRLERFVAHLDAPATFKRPHRVPTLAADHPQYSAQGDYWLGSVWAPTNYMVLRGLTRAGYDRLAHEIALNHHGNVVAVFERTGTVWENYAPESAAPGNIAKDDFVGWTGLPPVAVLFEYVFGLRADCQTNTLTWDVRLLEEHGVRQYPFGRDGLLDLRCEARSSASQRPAVHVTSNIPLALRVFWEGGEETVQLSGQR